jgi:hypothetical protein
MDIASYFPMYSEGGKGSPIDPGKRAQRDEPARRESNDGPPAGKVRLKIRRLEDDPDVVATTARFEFQDGKHLVATGLLPYDEDEGAGSGRLVIHSGHKDFGDWLELVVDVEVTGPKRWSVEGGG